MTDISNLLKKSLGKEMNSAMANNYSRHGDTSSVSDFAMSTNSLKKEVQEDGEKPKNTDSTLTKILSKIAKDLDDEETTKEEPKEMTGASSAGGYSEPLFGEPKKKKRKIKEEKLDGGLSDEMSLEDLAQHHKVDITNVIEVIEKGVNVEMEHTTDMLVAFEIAMDHIYKDLDYYDKLKDMENDSYKEESKEATTSSSSGPYDAPFGGPRKDPLSIDTPENVYSKLRSVTDKNFPRYGGKGGTYVKIKDKCKKFPYCNQGDINALEFFENNIVKEAIKRVSKRHNLDSSFIKGVIIERLNK
tara:strand:+ start:5268 stop:6170 length:903 start_codon:yes stop_codon:yes gene_type:complete